MTDYPFCFGCNNNCISCINKTEYVSKKPGPPLFEIKEIIDKIDPSSGSFCIGGGEPTLRKEFFDILVYARKKHPDMYIFLTTNGRMFCYRNFAKKLAGLNLGNFKVGVGIYGHNAKLHDYITQCKGSFNQTVLGIKNLIREGIAVETRVIINRLNYVYLPDISQFAVNNFPNIERFVFINMKYTGNALINKEKIFVKISDVSPFTEEGVRILVKNNINTRLFHFPLCLLPENFHEIAEGVTKNRRELTFAEECHKCSLNEKCPMIWKSYVEIAGEGEFKAWRYKI